VEKILDNKIQHLAKEAQSLANVKAGLQQQLGEINTRLTQITGALVELHKIKDEFKGDKSENQANS